MLRLTALSISTLGLVAILARSPSAYADPEDPCVADPSCRDHEDRGISFSAEKDYASALVEFHAAYARAPIPRLLINIGRSLFRLGQPQDALKYYERFLRAEPNADPEIIRKVQRYIEEAQSAAAVPPVLPEKVQQNPGETPTVASTPPTLPELATSSPRPMAIKDVSIAQPSGNHFPSGAGILIGVGFASLSVGLGLGVRALGLSSEVVGNAGPFDDALYSQGSTFNTAAITLDVLGGTALVAGGIWLGVWAGRRKHTEGRVASLRNLMLLQGSQ